MPPGAAAAHDLGYDPGTGSEQPMDPQEFEAQLRREGFAEVLTREQPPGYFLGEHAHAFDARALVTRGDITLTVGNAARTYPAGTVFELAAGCVHQERAGADGVTYRVGRRAA